MNNWKLFIPDKIIGEIWNKWFYLYRWIKYNDLINILKNKLIILINKFWKYTFIVLLILSIIIIPLLGNISYLLYFVWFFIFLWILAFIYLISIWIQYSYFILKNSFIILTNSFIVINGKIINILNYEWVEKELSQVEELFQKKLFLDDKKIFSYMNLIQEFKNWFHEIYKKKIWSIVFLLLIMYAIYIIIMSFIYFIWTILIMFMSIFLWIINKFILIKIWHKVMNINSLFLNIEQSSNKIENSKKYIQNLLLQGKEKKYEDLLIHTINLEIIKFNKNIEKTIDLNSKLKNEIKNSQYKDIYDFNIYNSWIKKEIYIPLYELKIFLEFSWDQINKQVEEIDNNIKFQKDEYKKVLELQKMRLDLFWKNIYDKINQINYYVTLLQNE